jgi:hypothetical protein
MKKKTRVTRFDLIKKFKSILLLIIKHILVQWVDPKAGLIQRKKIQSITRLVLIKSIKLIFLMILIC